MVDPGDLLVVASVARACALIKGEMRVAGVVDQGAFGGPLPPPTKEDVTEGESFERPVPLYWLLEFCRGPVRGIRLRAPGYGLGLGLPPVQDAPTTWLPTEDLEAMLKLGGLEYFGLWGYTLQPLQRLSGQGQPAAVTLDLSNAKLSQLDLYECTMATELGLDGGMNRSVQLGVRLFWCDALTSLTVRGTRVVSVRAVGCRSLTTLDCIDTSMRRFPSGALSGCPLLVVVKLPTTLIRISKDTFK